MHRSIADVVEAAAEKVKGASFVARAHPIEMAAAAVVGAEVQALVAAAREEQRDAVHHGWAYRVGPEHADFRWSDGGEPLGSTGRPILQRIDALGLVNVLVVVSRWHGGQKLSASDLARGYGDAAREALALATVVPFEPTTAVAITFDYAQSGPVQGVLAAFGARHVSADYGVSVRLVVRVPSEAIPGLRDALADASAGRATVELAACPVA